MTETDPDWERDKQKGAEEEEISESYNSDDSRNEQETNGAGKKSLRSGTRIGEKDISRFLKEARARTEGGDDKQESKPLEGRQRRKSGSRAAHKWN